MTRRSLIILLIIFALIGFFIWRIYESYNPPIRNYPKTIRTIVAFGDSLTRGHGAPRDKDYPKQLSLKLGMPVINAGLDGDMTNNGLARLDKDVLSHRPDLVLLCLGGNDMLARQNPDLVYNNLAGIVDQLQQQGAIVAIIEVRHVLPMLGYGDLYQRLAAEKQCIFIPDILGGIVTRPKLMKDQVHPNGAGYKKFSDKVYKSIKSYVDE